MNKITINKKPVRLRINGILCNVTNINAGAIIYPPEPIIPPSPTSEWIGVELPSDFNCVSLCYGGGKFLGISRNQNVYSEDGFNWAFGSGATYDSPTWFDVAYGNGVYVCVGFHGYSAYSNDAIDFKETIITNTTIQNPCIVYGNGKFVVLASINGYGYYSNNGLSWNELSYPYDSSSTTIKYGDIQDITYGNGVFVAVGTFSNIIQYSNDGVNWNYSRLDTSNTSTSSIDSVFLSSICYGDGRFITISGNDAFYSFDGINWTYFSLPNDVRRITYGDGKFVAIYYTYSLISKDGLNWWKLDMPEISTRWDAVTYGDGKFVALSTDGKAAILYASEIKNPDESQKPDEPEEPEPEEPEPTPSRLPDGYTELQYIESDGTQWIVTNIVPSAKTKIVMDIETTKEGDTTNQYFFDSHYTLAATYKYAFRISLNNTGIIGSLGRYTSTITSTTISTDKNPRRMTLQMDANTLTASVDTSSKTFSNNTFSSMSALQLLTYNKSATHAIHAKIYSVQIDTADVATLDFVPCIDPTGMAGMYDLVTDTFYGSSGTANFISGPPI